MEVLGCRGEGGWEVQQRQSHCGRKKREVVRPRRPPQHVAAGAMGGGWRRSGASARGLTMAAPPFRSASTRRKAKALRWVEGEEGEGRGVVVVVVVTQRRWKMRRPQLSYRLRRSSIPPAATAMTPRRHPRHRQHHRCRRPLCMAAEEAVHRR